MEFDLLNLALDLWLKPSLFLLAVVLYCRWNHARAPENCHWLLVNLGFCILLISVALLFLPRIDIEALPATYQFWQPVFNDSNSLSSFIQDNAILYAFMACYLLIASFILSAYVFDFISAHKIAKHAESLHSDSLQEMSESLRNSFSLKHCPAIACSSLVSGPMLWGHSSPIIVVPEGFLTWEPGRRYRVLAHEFAHIARRDWLIKNVFAALSSIFWMLPSIWPLMRKTNLYAEFSCDDRVVEVLDCRAEYAADLLDLSRAAGYTQVAPAFNDSRFLLQRIEQVLEGGRSRERESQLIQCLKLMSVLIVLLPVASVKFSAVDFPKQELTPIQLIVDSKRRGKSTRQPANSALSQNNQKDNSWREAEKAQVTVEPETFTSASTRSEESILTIANPSPSKVDLNFQVQTTDIDVERGLVQLKGFLPTNLVVPEYPRQALLIGKQANIEVEFDVGISGRVSNIRFIDRKEGRMFRKAIKKSLLSSQFSPLEINGMPVELKNIREVYSFIIDDTGSP